MTILYIIDYILLISGYFDSLIFFSDWDSFTSHELFPQFFVLIMAHIIAIGCSIFWNIIAYFIPAIPIYIMAYNAGYSKPWLALIPYGKTYISFIMPVAEYSYLGWFKTYNRSTAFWTYFALDMLEGICTTILGYIPFFGRLLALAYTVGKKLIHYGEYRDLLRLYRYKESASWVAGIGIVFPIVYWIYLYMACRKEPEFGFGNYYNPVFAEEY